MTLRTDWTTGEDVTAAVMNQIGTEVNANTSGVAARVTTDTSTSVDTQLPVFLGTGGKTLKRFTGSGILKAVAGVVSAITAPSGNLVGDTDTQTLTNKNLASGTNTFPTFSNIGGVAVSGTPSAGQVPTATSPSAASWQFSNNIGGVIVSGTPTTGQIPVATSPTAATWQTVTTGGGGVAVDNGDGTGSLTGGTVVDNGNGTGTI